MHLYPHLFDALVRWRVVRIVLVTVFSLLAISYNAEASNGSFELTIANYQGRHFIEPYDRTIVIRRQPMPFHIVIKNTAIYARKVYQQSSSGGYSSIAIEVTDEEGRRTVVRKRKEPTLSRAYTFDLLGPGESKVIHMLIYPDKWENIPRLEAGIDKQLKVRAVYNSRGRTIRSEYYKVILAGKTS